MYNMNFFLHFVSSDKLESESFSLYNNTITDFKDGRKRKMRITNVQLMNKRLCHCTVNLMHILEIQSGLLSVPCRKLSLLYHIRKATQELK